MNPSDRTSLRRPPDPFPAKMKMTRWVAPARLQAWWLYKTPILFGLVYAVASITQVPVEAIPPLLARLVAAIAPVGCFACVINEFTDEREDRIAGKANAMTGRSPLSRWSWVAGSGAGVCLGLLVLRDSPGEMGLYVADVLVFLLYSLPPVRLKTRGAWGVLADACAALVIPGLWINVAVGRQGVVPLPLPVWMALVAWTLGLGVRFILSHQACDMINDGRSGTATLGLMQGREGLERLGRRVAFPLEICGLPVLLWAGGGWPALSMAGTFLVSQAALARHLGIRLRMVDRQPGSWLLLFDFSILLFPLVFLPRLLQVSPMALLILPLHLLLFAPTWSEPGRLLIRRLRGTWAAPFG